MLPITKIYIDSRYRSADSSSSSDFKVELPETLSLPRDTKAYITDIAIPNTMTTIIKDYNDKIYWCKRFINTLIDPYQKHFNYWRFTIQEGNYTAQSLGEYLHTRLNDIELIKTTVLISSSVVNNTLAIGRNNSVGEAFRILTDKEVRQGFIQYDLGPDAPDPSMKVDVIEFIDGKPYNVGSDPQSINNIIKNLDDVSVEHSGSMLYTCSFLDLLPIRDIYITSPNFGSFDTASNFGMTGIIKRVPVSAGFGYLIYTGAAFEPSDGRQVGNLSLKTLYFRLVNSQNRTIDLKGSDVSFSVVFHISGDVM